jgi:hypothetical protein
MTNCKVKIKGIRIFGLVITTEKRIRNFELTIQDLIINPTEEQLEEVLEKKK